MSPQPLASVRDLNVRFRSPRGEVCAVNGVSFELQPGEVLGLIGESGCGKSVTLRALMRLLPEQRTVMTGGITVDGQDVASLKNRALSAYRGGTTAMVFQDPGLALDPVYTIGQQIGEAIQRHRGGSRAQARVQAQQWLEQVKVPSARARLDNYPHELSGGMRQRAMIALALSCGPKLVLADEPTTALDATVQMQVLLILRELQQRLGMGAVFVTHDLGVAAEICDRIAVMYAGRIVEIGSAEEVLLHPQHPYTQGLLAATLHGSMRGTRRTGLPGAPPDLLALPAGCAFAARCAHVSSDCVKAVPELRSQPGLSAAACWRLGAVQNATAAGAGA
ncbi:ABC transporter ATP-binding protein [Rhodoferax fermentans]|uniref:Dipeptide ABC transporter ATP-binding protein DppD n=1 Tax=Rhodoferax fermentans TaxID=28066 RepID=A0A1T1ATJ5_RHOFE|nr:ABC transporter ATP-binding protein [Rhodoferax fermentans]MBK1685002.1 ABC transporter ATP-binding protein [Rhodoferax fermentans]OOV07436.1 dipeptide ABC transporter ATP-binding protein DppD [Rhodoferax fermentans]